MGMTCVTEETVFDDENMELYAACKFVFDFNNLALALTLSTDINE
jgi:hypothetical protein